VTLVAVVVSTNAAESVYCIFYAVHKKGQYVTDLQCCIKSSGTPYFIKSTNSVSNFTTVRWPLHKCRWTIMGWK